MLQLAEVQSRGPALTAAGDVAAAGVNFIDVYHREGVYPLPLPLVLGQEGSGRVAVVGEGVSGWAVGDRVAWTNVPGSFAENVVVPADRGLRVPDGVDDLTAAAVPLQGMTAQYLATSTCPVEPGDDVLIHAAAGGVGLLLTQIVTHLGGRVLATVSTAEKAELARGAGAAEVIRYDQEDFAERARELTGGRGVRVVFDGVGRTTFDGSLAILAPRGMLVLFGYASGRPDPFDINRLQTGGSLFLTRPTMGHYVATPARAYARADDCSAGSPTAACRCGSARAT